MIARNNELISTIIVGYSGSECRNFRNLVGLQIFNLPPSHRSFLLPFRSLLSFGRAWRRPFMWGFDNALLLLGIENARSNKPSTAASRGATPRCVIARYRCRWERRFRIWEGIHCPTWERFQIAQEKEERSIARRRRRSTIFGMDDTMSSTQRSANGRFNVSTASSSSLFSSASSNIIRNNPPDFDNILIHLLTPRHHTLTHIQLPSLQQ